VHSEEFDATPARDCNKGSRDELLSDSKDEQMVDSQEAHARLEAALHSLGHSGTTLCSTASNARPTVLDYHYAYEHGERSSMSSCQVPSLTPFWVSRGGRCKAPRLRSTLCNFDSGNVLGVQC
jgi:hypothetical protein